MIDKINSPNNRIIGLDYFRISAALLIFLFHSAIHMDCFYGILQEFIEMGAVVMTGFFMLSGYALYQSYYKKDLSDIKEVKTFFLKRIVSLMPGYFFVCIVFFGGYAELDILERIMLIPIDLLNIESVYSSLFSVSHYGGTWFISCIVLCYMMFPYGLNIIKQLKMKEKIIIMMIFSFILLYSPILVWKFELTNIYSNPFFRILEFVLGMMLASTYSDINVDIKNRFLSTKLLIVEIILLILGVTVAVKLGIAEGNYMFYSWIGLPIFGLMILTLHNMEFKKYRCVSYASELSYSFFLAQLFIWRIVKELLKIMKVSNNVAIIAMSLIVCVVLAIMIHEIIEKNGKKLLKRILHI